MTPLPKLSRRRSSGWRVTGTKFVLICDQKRRWRVASYAAAQAQWIAGQRFASFPTRREALRTLAAAMAAAPPPPHRPSVQLLRQRDGSYQSDDGHWKVVRKHSGGWLVLAVSSRAKALVGYSYEAETLPIAVSWMDDDREQMEQDEQTS